MLAWLDPDPEIAGQIYNEIQGKLIRTFSCRGCAYPEYEVLAQDTIERVTRKFDDPGNKFSENYVGDPIAYFYGVARYVYREYMRNKKDEHQQISDRIVVPQTESTNDCLSDYKQQCLEECLKRESYKDRKLILQYYQEDRREKIDQRLKMADQQRENLNRLRIRMCRIRKRLRECINACMDRKSNASS
jgi:hypothetical protein